MTVRAQTTLRSSVTTPALARAFARETLARADAPALVDDDVTLVVSELVTNAVIHGAGDVTLGVEVGDEAVRVEVADRDPELGARPAVRVDAETGRGLLLVSRLAQRWGVRRDGPGKVVWADLVAKGAHR